MPTRRGYRKSKAKPSSDGQSSALMTGAKNLAKKGLEGYLNGTQKLADKISGALPESMTKPSTSRTSGRRRRSKRVGEMM